MKLAGPQVSVHQQDLGSSKRQTSGEVNRDGGFAFARHRASDEDRPGRSRRAGHEQQRRANPTIGFSKGMPAIVRVEKIQRVLPSPPGSIRYLAQEHFGKVELDLAN